jgi:hypothetical protein
VALYTSRTHGFFTKAPMQRDRVRDILAPFWADRFLSKGYVASQSSESENRDKEYILEYRLSVGGEALSMSGRMVYGAHCIR